MLADDGQDDKEDQADGDGDEQDKEGRHQVVDGLNLKKQFPIINECIAIP